MSSCVPVAFWTLAYTPIATINREKTWKKREMILLIPAIFIYFLPAKRASNSPLSLLMSVLHILLGNFNTRYFISNSKAQKMQWICNLSRLSLYLFEKLLKGNMFLPRCRLCLEQTFVCRTGVIRLVMIGFFLGC